MSLSDKTKKWLAGNAALSLQGKTAVITGANSGVGFKTAEILAYLGADVILACRNPQRAAAARDALAAEYPEPEISVETLDLADLSSVDAFADRLIARKTDIDVFINNAGVFNQPGKKTREGFDLVIGTNYLGVYALTERLLPYLSALPHRVAYINTVSLIHKYAPDDPGDFHGAGKYRALDVYARSKLCLAKYSRYKAEQYAASDLRVYMSHPGIALTPLGLNAVGAKVARLKKGLGWLFNTVEKSALSAAFILARDLPAGSIAGPNRFFGGWGYPAVNRVCKKVRTGAEALIARTGREIAAAKQDRTAPPEPGASNQ